MMALDQKVREKYNSFQKRRIKDRPFTKMTAIYSLMTLLSSTMTDKVNCEQLA